MKFFKRDEKPLNRIDRRLAKRWVKGRLLRVFPELRGHPEALEELYRSLDLEAKPGVGKGGSTVFQVVLPDKFQIWE